MALEGDLEVAVTDGPVRFAFTVTNAGSTPERVQFSDACKADFAVLEEGREVWRYAADRSFAQVLDAEVIEAGETLEYDGEWPDPQPGTFTAVATLCAQGHDCEARREFAVE